MSEILIATDDGLFGSGSDGPVVLEGRHVDALSRHGSWAIVDGHHLWLDRDGWAKAATSDRDLACVMPLPDGSALIGTAEAHLLRFRDGALQSVDDFEDVSGKEEWFTPWGGPPSVRSMARMDSEVYVNVHVGGIVRGNRSDWQPTIDIRTDVHEVKVVDDEVIAACAVGFTRSGDRGASWSFDDAGLHATYARAVTATSTSVFMSVSRGPRGGDAGIYRKPRAVAGFTRCDLPSFRDNIDTGCLVANDSLVAFGTLQGDLYVSRDEGSNWELAREGLPPIRHLALPE